MASGTKSARLTVVIPTRERVDTLRESLRTVLAQEHDDLTIVVSDNASEDGTRDFLESQKDSRLHLLRTPRRLSMAGNYEFALTNLPHREGWVMLIGDDDGLLPGGARRATQLLADLQTRVVKTPTCAYAWPSLTGLTHGRLGVPTGHGVERRDARTWLKRVMQCKASYHELPMLYQGGVVEVSLVDEIRARSGSFYRSCIPDVYSAMAIASTVESYFWVGEPLSINGLSRHSIGMSQVKDGFATSSPSRKFQVENNIAFHPEVPLREDGDYPVGQAVVYEPFLQSAFLRSAAPLTSHGEQLVLVLAQMATDQRGVMDNWPERFAQLHGLDLAAARRRALAVRPALFLRRLRAQAAAAMSTHAVGSAALPLRTVYEASVAAGAVRSAISSNTQNLPHVSEKAWRRVAQELRSRLGR